MKRGFWDSIRGLTFKVKIIAGGLIFLFLVVMIVVLFFHTSDSKLSVISETSLEKIIEIDDLSTIEYTYNAIATKKGEDKEPMYYVSYEGNITAGIDFKEVEVKVDDKKKQVVVTIPDVEIQGVNVDIKTMDYIFTKSKYETENVTQEAYKLCKTDLKERAENDIKFKDMAKENAIDSIEALFKPWIESLDKDYELKVK